MEISRVGRNAPISRENKKVETKRDFSQSFNFARDRKNEQQLKELLDAIKTKGNRLLQNAMQM